MTDLDSVAAVAKAGDFFAVVSTAHANNAVHSTVVKAGVLPHPVSGAPSVALVLLGGAAKLRYLRANGRAAVAFMHQGRWAAVEGPVTMYGPDDDTSVDVLPTIRAVYVAAGGTHDDWDAFDRAMAEDRRCAVFVAAERITGTG
jgi:hypothetical protein